MPKLTLTLDVDPAELYLQRLLLAYLSRFDIENNPVDGLLSLTDVIADELADNGDERALLNESAGEEKLGRRLLEDLHNNMSNLQK